MTQALYVWLVIAATVDLFLAAIAQGTAATGQAAGRLAATFLLGAGLVFASLGRSFDPPAHNPPIVTVGIVLMNLGLTAFALFLPTRSRRGKR